jgi:LacI family repressor for deo operon, udp, cdd, tsx, nupC, and nupG
VSRVLNDKPGVAQRTRGAVIAAMDVLGIERPAALQARDVGLIGIVVPELENPIFPRLARAIEASLVARRYTPVIGQQGVGGVHEDDYVHSLLNHGVRGLVFVSGIHALEGADPRRYQKLLDMGLPIVLVNGGVHGLATPSFSVDDTAVVDLAVEHLAALGHTRIGLAMGEPRYQPVIRRSAAFWAAMRRHAQRNQEDQPMEPLIECTEYSIEGGASAADLLLDQEATALICGSDVMAIGAIHAATARGLRVPDDVSIVGSDDSILMPYLSPALTTVRHPAEAMGAAAADALVSQIVGLETEVGEHLFAPELIVRSSTAPPAAHGGHRGR